MGAVRTHEVAHILDNAERRDVELPVHCVGSPAVGERDLLRCRHDNGSGDRHRLAETQRDVARARGQVDDEIIDVDPANLAEKLLQGAVQHRPTPDNRCVVAREKAHRDDLQAVLLGRHDLLAVGRELGVYAEHDRHIRPIDVAVHHADAAAAFGERDCDVHRDRRLANAPLARANGDHVLHPGQQRSGAVGSRCRANLRAHLHVDRRHSRQLHHRSARLIAHLILHRTCRRRQLDCKRHATVVDAQILDETEADDVAVKIGIVDDPERIQHRSLLHCHILKNICFGASITRMVHSSRRTPRVPHD